MGNNYRSTALFLYKLLIVDLPSNFFSDAAQLQLQFSSQGTILGYLQTM